MELQLGGMAVVGIATGVAVLGLIAYEVWGRRARKTESYWKWSYEQQRAHQQELLESMRKEAAARAAFEGVDFVLMPCVCGAPEASYAVDCPRCDDTGFVEVVV